MSGFQKIKSKNFSFFFFFFFISSLKHDWKDAEHTPEHLTNAEWDFFFLQNLRLYYNSAENPIIRNFEFRQIAQLNI